MVLAAALVGGALVAWSLTQGADPPMATEWTPAAAGVAAESPSAASTPTPECHPATVTVHVVGRVRRPGLIEVPCGARVADAVMAAGGVRGDRDPGVNLARLLADGERVEVGLGRAPAPGPTSGGSAPTPVSLNSADAEVLATLPGIGPVLAERIVAYREAHGGFGSVEELQDVSGIGPARLADLADRLTL